MWRRRLSKSVPSASMFAAAWKHVRVLRIMRNSKNLSLQPKVPDRRGHFGPYGGRYVAETLMPALAELEQAYAKARRDAAFRKEFHFYLSEYVGRETPLYFAERLSEKVGGAKIYLKREDLCHTGAHKINNTIGQILLARRMGKQRIIAETGAGQHGVATATVAARFGLQCEIFMGKEDVRRQSLNVFRMKLLGAKVRVVEAGSQTLKDAMNEALRDWVTNVRSTYYLIGSVAGPHPYPMMVRDFQSVIGRKRAARFSKKREGCRTIWSLASAAAAIRWGFSIRSCAICSVKMLGVEAAGRGLRTGKHSASIQGGTVGVLHGSKSYVLQNELGQITETHSIAAGLDYPGVGPELSYLRDSGRARIRFGNGSRSDRRDQVACRSRRHYSGA